MTLNDVGLTPTLTAKSSMSNSAPHSTSSNASAPSAGEANKAAVVEGDERNLLRRGGREIEELWIRGQELAVIFVR